MAYMASRLANRKVRHHLTALAPHRDASCSHSVISGTRHLTGSHDRSASAE
jgi:hypothetical protein